MLHATSNSYLGRIYVISVFIGAATGVALVSGRPGFPGTSMQAAAWVVCTTAANRGPSFFHATMSCVSMKRIELSAPHRHPAT